MYRIFLSRDAEKYLARLERSLRERIIEALERLPEGDVKRLKGCDSYRLRVGDDRVIFDRNARLLTIQVIKIAPRGEIYK